MNLLSETEAAYLAGLIDGEGCISITRTRTNASAKGCKRGFSYRSSVVVAMTDHDVLEWCHRLTGVGNVCPKRTNVARHKPAWSWSVWSTEAWELCIAVLPYLKVKLPQAANLIEFQSKMRYPGKFGLTDHEWNAREASYLMSKKLNKRGVA